MKSDSQSSSTIATGRSVLVDVPTLTRNPWPVGWDRPADSDAVQAAELTVEPGKPSKMRKEGRPSGLRRLWRYARGIATMLRRNKVVRSYPLHLQLEVTDACNLHCTTCSRDVLVHKPSMLDAPLWKKMIDEMQPTNINVSGIGEPFLHPDIFEIIRYAKDNGAAVNCATNLTRVKNRYREIVESGIDQLKVSIDAVDPKTYQIIRGEKLFGHIIDNIREIIRWREKLQSKSPSIRFNFALQCFNYQQAPDLVDLASELGVDGIYYQFLAYVDMEDRKTMLTDVMTRESLQDSLEEAGRRAKRAGIKTNLDMWRRDIDIFWNNMQAASEYRPNNKQCYFPWISTWLGADGWVRPCPIMPWTLDEGRMGRLDEQSFGEIWNSPTYRELRAALMRGERPTRSCKNCYPQDLYNIISIKSKLLP